MVFLGVERLALGALTKLMYDKQAMILLCMYLYFRVSLCFKPTAETARCILTLLQPEEGTSTGSCVGLPSGLTSRVTSNGEGMTAAKFCVQTLAVSRFTLGSTTDYTSGLLTRNAVTEPVELGPPSTSNIKHSSLQFSPAEWCEYRREPLIRQASSARIYYTKIPQTRQGNRDRENRRRAV